MANNIAVERGLEVHECPVCFVTYAAPARLYEIRRQDGQPFFCPNGHRLTYTENENDKIRRERDRLKQENARLQDWLNTTTKAEAEARAETKATKRQLTKLKKQVDGGECPDCHRKFPDLQNHRKHAHPQLVNANAADDRGD